jgi:hypothetical protein
MYILCLFEAVFISHVSLEKTGLELWAVVAPKQCKHHFLKLFYAFYLIFLLSNKFTCGASGFGSVNLLRLICFGRCSYEKFIN